MYHIRQAILRDADIIAAIHAACFPKQFLTLLAPKALSKYYQFFIEHPLGICFIVEEKRGIVGFISGWERRASYQQPLLYKNGFRFAAAIARSLFCRPLITLSLLKPRLTVLIPLLKDYLLFLGSGGRKKQGMDYHCPDTSCLSIAVLNQHRGTEAARLLNQAFVEECRSRDVKDIVLSVHNNNHRARLFYEKNGWRVLRREKDVTRYKYNVKPYKIPSPRRGEAAMRYAHGEGEGE